MPVKTFTINASSGSVVFPGARLDSEYNAETLATKLILGASLENIEVIGNKLSTVYMPSVNDWSNYTQYEVSILNTSLGRAAALDPLSGSGGS